MVSYPTGQPGSPGEQPYCQGSFPVTSAVPPPRTASRRRTKWLIAAAGITAVLWVAGGAAGIVMTKSAEHARAPQPTMSSTAAMQQWWSAAQDDFTETQRAAGDVQAAMNVFRPGALAAACQRVHDSAEVGLKSHLPSPDAELTAELHAAIEDYHSAAHLCLAVVAGSPVNYDGEFLSSMAQADKHLRAARNIIKRILTSV
ncbi:hypothetical protein [Mycobacterium branderi]|nr:hypothetical protein [Mycobacterium branderi]MCV7231129.1 hypothetical protein [Mycobacterium branderi]